jgi:hypothetical protein
MSDTNNRPNKDGTLRGDSKGISDRGTKTGLNGDTYGASLDRDATNSQGSFDAGSNAVNEKPGCNNK